MDFKEFFPESEEGKEEKVSSESENSENSKIAEEKIGQNQFYDVITSKKPDWQAVIYDLIHSEQLDPWDIDIVLLTRKYFEKVLELEEELEGDDEMDFYVSSKILLAASLLLRIKSEFLLNKHLRSIDEILFGKKQESKPSFEKIEIDEDELPLLIPKTPMSRQRKVTLPELMAALNKAINTESRRIKREVAVKRAKKLSEVDFPTFKRIDLKDRIRQFYARILTSLRKKQKPLEKVSYSSLVGTEKEERLACFLPLLHLDNNKKLWTEQKEHLDEIWVYLYEYFDKNKRNLVEDLEEDIKEMKEELESSEFLDSEDSKVGGLEKARLKREDKKRLAEEITKELEQELGIATKEEKIDEISGFSDEN